jgi:hypothetical protein
VFGQLIIVAVSDLPLALDLVPWRISNASTFGTAQHLCRGAQASAGQWLSVRDVN